MAKSALADAQGSSSQLSQCRAIQQIANLKPTNAEKGLHPILKKHGLALPIQLSPVTGKPDLEGYPRLKPKDFLSYMAESGNLHRLLGGVSLQSAGPVLADFWAAYRLCHEDFELFSKADLNENIELQYCIPIHVHADGGRGYKRSEFMVFNWSAVLGTGTGKQNKKDPAVRQCRKRRNRMRVNLLGHSYGTHYMWAVMPSTWHKKDNNFQDMLTQLGEDFRECFETGITIGGHVWRLVVLGLKGDLKLQARALCLTRWYSTSRKAPHNPDRPTQTLGRCCWLCMAGDLKFPFEEFHSEEPAWWTSMEEFAAEPPWDPNNECQLISLSLRYVCQPAKFALPDLFHIYLAGFGQDYAACCLVYLLPVAFQSSEGNSVEAQLDVLNQCFKLWRQLFKVQTHTGTFNRNLLTYTDNTKTYPTGTWSKASDTAKIVAFIEHTTDMWLDEFPDDKILYYINSSTKALASCMQDLYDADLWIDPCPESLINRATLCFV